MTTLTPKERDAREISRRTAQLIGLVAIGLVIGLQAVNSFVCYKHDFSGFLNALGFIALPMLPAIVAFWTANPLRSLGASMLFAPWLVLAFYTDCIRPYQGGGASMIYVAVVMYGFATALVGAVLSGYFFRKLGITVAPKTRLPREH